MVIMADLGGIGSTAEISEVKKSVLAPTRLTINNRKTLPPLPPLSPVPESPSFEKKQEDADLNRITNTLESLLASLEGTEKDVTLSFKAGMMGERPPRPISKDPRPTTAATVASTMTMETAVSGSSFASKRSRRAIKYGTGKYADVELSPQPSEDPSDPLNWPSWKKHMNLGALLFTTALVGAMKTAYVSVNSEIAVGEGVSYTAAVALTAVPLMVSAVAGLVSLIIARIWGKRPVYLISVVFIFIGTVWNTTVRGSIEQNMAARIFQGLGWGSFDTLVLGSIQDTYFEHERQSKIVSYYAISTATMLGAPLLGGVASMGPRGFELQYEIMSAFMAVSVLLLAFGAPETMYDRVYVDSQSPTLQPSQSPWPNVTFTKAAVMQYLAEMKPRSYQANEINIQLILQAPRAMIAPTTGILFALTFLPYAGLWGLSSSLSMLFSTLPFMLTSDSMGALLAGPFLLATPVAIALTSSLFVKRFTRTVHLTTLVLGSAFASIGMLGFGFYLVGTMEMSMDDPTLPFSTQWGMELTSISLPIVSFLLGLLAAGSLTLDATIRPVIQRSAAFTSANLAVCLRNKADMHGGVTCLRNLVAGSLILGIPNTVVWWEDLKTATIAIGVMQIVFVLAVCFVYRFLDESVQHLDGRVMGLVDLSILKKTSYFDTD